MKRTDYWQIAAVAVVSLAAFWLAGLHGALSAVLGAVTVWIGSRLGVMSMRQVKGNALNGGTALLLLLRAEAIKIVVVAVLLLLIFKLYTASVPFAVIAGLAVTALLSGLGLTRINEKE